MGIRGDSRIYLGGPRFKVCPKGCSRVLGFKRLFDRGHTVAATHIGDVEFHAEAYLVLKLR